jgi:DNA invertase Pin-like site-specific DNA recombinase
MTDYIFTRVSDEKQEDGTSPETQLANCVKYIGHQNYIHVHDTQKGGIALKRRKKLMDLIALLEKGDRLICARSDRLSRNDQTIAVIKHYVEEKGAKIEYADGTKVVSEDRPADWMQMKMLEMLAQYERIVISSRIRTAYIAKKEKKEAMGFARFGYKNEGGKVVEDATNYPTLLLMRDLRKQGMSYRKIADRLNDGGSRNSQGRAWHFQQVQKILARDCE